MNTSDNVTPLQAALAGVGVGVIINATLGLLDEPRRWYLCGSFALIGWLWARWHERKDRQEAERREFEEQLRRRPRATRLFDEQQTQTVNTAPVVGQKSQKRYLVLGKRLFRKTGFYRDDPPVHCPDCSGTGFDLRRGGVCLRCGGLGVLL